MKLSEIKVGNTYGYISYDSNAGHLSGKKSWFSVDKVLFGGFLVRGCYPYEFGSFSGSSSGCRTTWEFGWSLSPTQPNDEENSR